MQRRFHPKCMGVGGPLSAMVVAISGYHSQLSFWILCPLWGLIFSLLTILFPFILPILGLLAIKLLVKPNAALTGDEIFLNQDYVRKLAFKQNIAQIFGYTVGHLAFLSVLFWLCLYYTDIISAQLIEAMSNAQGLQIGTEAQRAAASNLMNFYSAAAVVLLIECTVIFSLVTLNLLGHTNAWRTTISFVVKNLPGIAVIGGIAFALVLIIERLFAHYKISYLESVMIGQSGFDPTILFMVLRLCVIHCIFMAIWLLLMFSLGLLHNPYFKVHDDSEFKESRDSNEAQEDIAVNANDGRGANTLEQSGDKDSIQKEIGTLSTKEQGATASDSSSQGKTKD